ncbi:hypothetical protein AHAS_Ahas10G0136700 [Arachis hypogaea]
MFSNKILVFIGISPGFHGTLGSQKNSCCNGILFKMTLQLMMFERLFWNRFQMFLFQIIPLFLLVIFTMICAQGLLQMDG